MKYLSAIVLMLKSAVVIVLMAGSLSAQPESYEPIFQITGENSTSYIGSLIANCGDQNGDGADELLLSSSNPYEVFLFYGGSMLDTIPDSVFNETGYATHIDYNLNITSSDYGTITLSYIQSSWGRIYLYNSGDELDTNYDMCIYGESYGDVFGYQLVIGDVNGDGWNDIVTSAAGYDPGGDYNGKLYVYFGGEDMDNIADFTITSEYNNFGSGLGSDLACGDVNGDGYADILAMTSSPRKAWLFYGGVELDSIPDWSYQAEWPVYLVGLCAINPSLNGDEFADIVVKEMGGNTLVFFGGIVVNTIPDQMINTSVGNPVFVGNLNGDEYGDMAAFNQTGDVVRTLLGNPDGLVIGETIYSLVEPNSLGYCGDVNGDGFDDIAYSSSEPDYYGQEFVYADTTLTAVIVNPEPVNTTFTLLPNYPNPFNSQTTIPFTLDRAGRVELRVYDVLGREVQSLVTGHLSLGKHEMVWEAGGCASGVYLVRMSLLSTTESRQHMEARKVMLVK